ncbi:MAG TPA: LysM peptidoglycan-binding domain-containing protein [Spirochaetota bacterium]|nr:LysM peptidoglycan-binding domain-containing protein [Spirochaetota bacterium]HOM39035.1 LysM peptidoglycan-binding domain-containing protein [Spirochaetota bacterium]HPQ49912.1 LysM peptidoglycan-binding domain-containing protein [Spirochaetota bacterium]
MVEKRTQEVEVRKKSKKLDWIIYLLAFISLILMVVVIITNNKTDVKVVDIKPIISDITEKEQKTITDTEEKIEPKKIEPTENKEITKEKDNIKDAKTIAKKEEEKEIKKTEKDIKEVKESIKEKEKTKKVEKQEKTIKENIVDKKYIDYKNYNWKALKRYKVKPDKNLYIVSEYTVQEGDALWKIAQKMGVKTINIIAVNNTLTNPNLILPGQVILIPNM